MMKALCIKKIVIAMAITLVVAVLPAAGINHVLAETAKTEETSKKPTTKKASSKKDEVKKEVKKVPNEKKEKVEEAKNEDQPTSTVQAKPQAAQQTSHVQVNSSNATYNSEPAHPISEPIQGSIQVEQIPETSTSVQETTTPSSGIQVETPAPAPSQPNGTEGVHQQPTVVVDEVVELN